jgi:IclR family transcriptional regulator, acetate operon repressor
LNETKEEMRRPLLGTLERGLAILEFLSENDRVTVPRLAEALNLKRSTVYRLVNMLQERGYVESPRGSSEVVLGTRAVKLGVSAMSSADILQVAPAPMKELASGGLGTVFLAIPDGDCVVYVAREEGPQAINLSARLGTRRPLHCTALGKAYLSALPVDERRSVVEGLEMARQTPNTITSPQALLEELSETAVRGYAVDRVENEEGVACVAAPIRDYGGRPIASVSLAGVAATILEKVPELGVRINRTSAEMCLLDRLQPRRSYVRLRSSLTGL